MLVCESERAPSLALSHLAQPSPDGGYGCKRPTAHLSLSVVPACLPLCVVCVFSLRPHSCHARRPPPPPSRHRRPRPMRARTRGPLPVHLNSKSQSSACGRELGSITPRSTGRSAWRRKRLQHDPSSRPLLRQAPHPPPHARTFERALQAAGSREKCSTASPPTTTCTAPPRRALRLATRRASSLN